LRALPPVRTSVRASSAQSAFAGRWRSGAGHPYALGRAFEPAPIPVKAAVRLSALEFASLMASRHSCSRFALSATRALSINSSNLAATFGSGADARLKFAAFTFSRLAISSLQPADAVPSPKAKSTPQPKTNLILLPSSASQRDRSSPMLHPISCPSL